MKIPVSDTQSYKQFGNAVVVPVVEAVARHMQPFLEQALENEATQGALVEQEVA
jgi:DNA (cytosine-5)-methyltransferase 1